MSRLARLLGLFACLAAGVWSGLALAEAQDDGAAPEAQTAAESDPEAVPDDYIIGPGDTIQVFVWRNPELSVTVPVQPDGKV